MPLIDRNDDSTTKRVAFSANFAATATGVTSVIGILPFNSLVTGYYASAFGLSGTPLSSLSLYRFIAGSGFTAIPVGGTLTVPAFGTSGFAFYGATVNGITYSNVLGITALQGDLMVALSGGANSAAASLYLGVVMQPTDDYIRWPGL